jgi:phospholipid/cholesterol/gamma-HCH transport system substrate-binding protein
MIGSLSKRYARLKAQPGLGRDVRVLVFVVVLGIAVTSFMLVKQRVHAPWEDRYQFAAVFESVPAVSPGHGQEVRIAGVPVGDITKATVTKNGHARLVMQLDKGYKVFKNATLVLRPKSPLNEMYVEMDAGTPDSGKLTNNGVLPVTQTKQPVQVDEVLSHLDQRTRNAISSLITESDIALTHAQPDLTKGVDAATKTATNLKPLMTALATRRAKIARLVTDLGDLSRAVGGNDTRLAALAKDVSVSLAAVAQNNSHLDASLAQLPGVVGDLGSTTKKVSTLTTQLKPTLDNVTKASRTLPTALTQLTKTMDSLHELARVAAPVVTSARPVIRSLRPIVRDLNTSMTTLHPVTTKLSDDTATILPYLTSLKNFFYNTASQTSLSDANGGIFRGMVQEGLSALPVAPPVHQGATP